MVAQSVRCRVFVGRRKELAALEDARKSLAQSSGCLMLISGEAGIGKTRLLSEFLGLAQNRRARNLVNTECMQRAQQPLGPIRSLLRALLPTVELANISRLTLRALSQTIPEELPSDVASANAGVVLEKEQLFSALAAFLQHVCSKRATVLTVEDIHWSDESTVEFLAYLAHRMETLRLLVVATCRSDELERSESLITSLSRLLREPVVHRLMLEPLPSTDIRAVVDGTLEGHDPLPEGITRDIERRSEGNPFFAEELVKHYIERGASNRSAETLPLSIRASITQRLVDLDPDERAILTFAAVLGQRFDPVVLSVVMERSVDSLAPALRHARDLNLLIDEDRVRLSCRFRHALTRQTIYESVPAFETRSLHSKILATLEAQPENDGFLEELAYHAWEAGDAVKTVLYNERAGDAAFSLRALPESLTCYQRALDAATDLGDRARLLERVGAIERVQGHSQAALDVLETALAIRLDRGEIDAATSLAASVVGQRYNVGDQSVLAYAEQFLEDHQAQMGTAARDLLAVITARVASAFCDFPRAQRLLDSVSDPATLARSVRQNYLIVQLMRHAYAGNVREWKRHAVQVDQLIPHLPPESVVSVEAALAMTGIYLGTHEQIERALERAERIEREWGFRGQRLYAIATKAAYLYQRGRLEAARECIEEVVAHQDFHPARRVAAVVAAHLSVALGDAALWNRFDPDVLREARESPDDPDCIFILGAHAAVLAENGELSQAQSDLRCAIRNLEYAAPEAMYVAINAARYLPVGELSRVCDLVDASAMNGSEINAATRAFVQATIASRIGREKEAALAGAAAAHRYASLGWSLLEGRAQELAGNRDSARAIFNRCGATADARRVGDPLSAATAAAPLLSSRENEVATLVARGLRNSEIAKRLSIGSKTVEKHLASVFDKLGLRSRSQVVAYMTTASRDRDSSR